MRRKTQLRAVGAVLVTLAAAPLLAATPAEPKQEAKVYLAPHGKVYHHRGCIARKHLKSPESVTRKEAQMQGPRECYYCFADHPEQAKPKR